jgi:dehydrogenase/reductase SDR family protein 7B
VGRPRQIRKWLLLDRSEAPIEQWRKRGEEKMTGQQGKTAWITGASSGIGEALARAFLADGGNCILSGRNVAALEGVAEGMEDRCLVLPFEVTDYACLPGIVDQAAGFRGRIDILVNNAGISQRSLAVDTDFAVYQRIIDVDLLAPIALTQALLPLMRAQGTGQFVMMSSVAGKAGAPLRTAYSAAKHGLVGYADALRAEVTMLGLNVLVVTPGSVRTNVSRNALTADGSARGSSDVAIENGLDPAAAARLIWNAVATGTRELAIAEGVEAEMLRLRAQDPEKLFDMVAGFVAKGYAKQMDEQRGE